MKWVSDNTPEEVNRTRLKILASIEKLAQRLVDDGSAKKWSAAGARFVHVAVVRCGRLAGADYGVWSVSRNVNGPLMLALAEKIGYHDKGAIEMFRRGGPLIGLLPCSGA